LLQARLTQFHFDSDYEKAGDQMRLALMKRLAGDTTGARVTAEQACNTFEQLSREQPENFLVAAMLSDAYVAMGEKRAALNMAERAIVLLPRAKDRLQGPAMEENLAFIQTTFGANDPAISTLAQLLQTPYYSWFCATI